MMILSIYIRIEYTSVFQIHAKKRGACTVHYYKTLVVVNVVVSHVGDLNFFFILYGTRTAVVSSNKRAFFILLVVKNS